MAGKKISELREVTNLKKIDNFVLPIIDDFSDSGGIHCTRKISISNIINHIKTELDRCETVIVRPHENGGIVITRNR